MSDRAVRLAGRANPGRNSTGGLLRASVGLTVSSLVVQLAISPTAYNLAAASCAAAASLVAFFYLFGRPSAMALHPLSSLGLLGLNVSTLSGALVYQSVVWTPLTAHLANPVRTFAYLGAFQLTLIASHLGYSHMRLLASVRSGLSSKVIARLGLFRPPTSLELWLLGLIGLGAIWFSSTTSIDYGDVGGKFTVGLLPLAYAPFLVPFLSYMGAARRLTLTKLWPVAVYGVALIAGGIIKNSRATIALALITPVLVFFLLYVSGALRPSARRFVAVALCVVSAVVVLGYATDFGTAMIMVRSQGSKAAGVDLLQLTLRQFNDRRAVQAFRQSINSPLTTDGYSEYYISNLLLARFITVKFDDNMLGYADLLSPGQREEIATVSWQKTVALLPTPVIQLLGLDVNKSDLEFSMGGAIYNAATGTRWGYYKVGSMAAHGLILFGPFFYLIVFLVAPIVFLTADAFTRSTENELRYAPFALIFIFSFWTMFNGDSLINIADFMFRTLPQSILIYAVLSKALSFLRPSFPGGRATRGE